MPAVDAGMRAVGIIDVINVEMKIKNVEKFLKKRKKT